MKWGRKEVGAGVELRQGGEEVGGQDGRTISKSGQDRGWQSPTSRAVKR